MYWTVSSDVSVQRCHWQPLSVHLEAYCPHPTHDVIDVMCEGCPQHQGLHPLLISNSGVGSFTSHKNQISVSVVRRDLLFFVLIQEDLKVLTICRCHWLLLLSYLKTLSVGPAGVSNPWPPAQQTSALPTEPTRWQ